MKINFLIADEIRPEAGSKQTVLGLYADQTIILEPNPSPTPSLPPLPENFVVTSGIERLAFLINVSEIEGKHSFKGQIIDPSKNPHGSEMVFGEFEIAPKMSRTFVIEAKPFQVKETGTYRFILTVDDKEYELPFNIIERDSIDSPK